MNFKIGDIVVDKRLMDPEFIHVDFVDEKYIYWVVNGQRFYGDIVNFRKVCYEQLSLFEV